jgi:hypothetical protein
VPVETAAIVIAQLAVAVADVESVTRAVQKSAPVTIGIPVIAPVAELSTNNGEREPPLIA